MIQNGNPSLVDKALKALKNDKEMVDGSLNEINERVADLARQADEKKNFNELLDQAKELQKSQPPLIAFRVTGTTTKTTANPGYSDKKTYKIVFFGFPLIS